MARLIMRALSEAGYDLTLASTFRSYDSSGDAVRQERLAEIGCRLAQRLVRRWRGQPQPAGWFTYHLYHKAPDWLGPPVSRALGIPYFVAEASYAPKRAGGVWDRGHEAVATAVARAAAVFCLNPNDEPCLVPLVDSRERLVPLLPFIDPHPYRSAALDRAGHRTRLAAQLGLDPVQPWLLTVGMMRSGDKLSSYGLLGAALSRLAAREWRLVVVGDGPARREVEAALEPLGPGRVRFAGETGPDELAGFYAAADLMVWPAIREAYGMALLEAQATGLPVVAGRSDGVPAVVAHGETGLLTEPGNADALAIAVGTLLDDPRQRAAMARAAMRRVEASHSLAGAAATLRRTIGALH